MKERMQKTLAEVKGCPQKDRTESEGYVGVQTFMWICEDNIVEVPFALSRRVIEEYHQGRIGVVYSELGKGTDIRITLKRYFD